MDLARRFVEQMVSEAVVAGREREPAAAAPAVDWQSLWATADGMASPERAAGRVVLAAGRLAQTLTGAPELVEGPPASVPEGPWTSAPPAPAGPVSAAPAPVAPAPAPTAPAAPLAPPPPRFLAPRPVVIERISGTPAPSPSPPPAAPSSPPEPEPPTSPSSPGPTGSVPPSPAVSSGTSLSHDDTPTRRRGTHAAKETPAYERPSRLSTTVRWIVTIAVVIVLFALWQVEGTTILEHHGQSQLAAQFHARLGHAGATASGLLSVQVVPAAPTGSVLAHLRIPAIGVDQFVVDGAAGGDLEKGPGHDAATAVPGQAGNVVIDGHRTTFGAPFSRLDELHGGDPITVTTLTGDVLTYDVSQAPTIVSSNDTSIDDYFGDNRLTLTTSDPKYIPNSSLVVVALLQQQGASTALGGTASSHPVGRPPGTHTLGSPARWNWGELPLAIAIVIALMVLGLLYHRLLVRLQRPGALAIVMVASAVGLFFVFQAVTSIVPSTY
jgi:sortase A